MSKTTLFWLRLCIILVICIAIYFGVLYYVNNYYHAKKSALEELNSTSKVQVSYDGDTIVFKPTGQVKAGLIFYPGAKIEYTSYAPLLNRLASNGVLTIITKMPCNLASLKINAADGIIEKYPETDNWYIGGHSLGGAIAASYLSKHTEEYKGLVLLGAYSTADLSESDLKACVIYAGNENLYTKGRYKRFEKNLPKSTSSFVIEGGCHSYFGCYGIQKHDGAPTISNDEQIEESVDYILKVLDLES